MKKSMFKLNFPSIESSNKIMRDIIYEQLLYSYVPWWISTSEHNLLCILLDAPESSAQCRKYSSASSNKLSVEPLDTCMR